MRQSIAPAGPQPGARPTLTEAQRQQMQQLRSQTKTIMLSVAQMAQKYEAPIRQLTQEVQPQKEKWAADLKSIANKNATPEQRERMAAHGGRMREPGGMRRFFRPAMFLLMDPTAPAASSEERSVGSTSFYPNPAAATSNLEYEVKKAGPVTVDLLDKNGNKLRTLLSETKVEKGAYTKQLDLYDLPPGTYFYKITTKSGSETKRFVKE
ncbi:T9SS type A sorting domain-containing protein [Hymenobacter humi]|uniref:T9SS type A sorting domain-containing protein n=1 Tax=Hymenobacter humi TaxID=1411620 RepID=A0ABW2UBX4_9BACT